MNSELNIEDKINQKINFGGYNLPNSMDISKWGETIFTNNYKKANVQKPNSILYYDIEIQEDRINVNLKNSKNDDKILLS